jgi:Flp pilus assembly protein TadD
MISLLLAAAVVAAPASDAILAEAAHALSSGRPDQAKAMIGTAVAAGARGSAVDRLLADLAFETGRHADALAGYKALLAASPANMILAERAAIAALKSGQIAEASDLARRATSGSAASWRAWNALGVVSDLAGDWAAADAAYSRATQLSPDRAEIANNHGWSLLLRGQWEAAIPPLQRAAALSPTDARIRANLELALAAVADDLPRRGPQETSSQWAARLNDAGVVAQRKGDRRRSIAAFARAIEARSTWFERAANNLKLAQASP